jgi:hypothetical protein
MLPLRYHSRCKPFGTGHCIKRTNVGLKRALPRNIDTTQCLKVTLGYTSGAVREPQSAPYFCLFRREAFCGVRNPSSRTRGSPAGQYCAGALSPAHGSDPSSCREWNPAAALNADFSPGGMFGVARRPGTVKRQYVTDSCQKSGLWMTPESVPAKERTKGVRPLSRLHGRPCEPAGEVLLG